MLSSTTSQVLVFWVTEYINSYRLAIHSTVIDNAVLRQAAVGIVGTVKGYWQRRPTVITMITIIVKMIKAENEHNGHESRSGVWDHLKQSRTPGGGGGGGERKKIGFGM